MPENAEVVSGRKKIKTAAKVWEDRLCEKSWVKGAAGGREVAAKEVRAESLQQNLQNKSVGRGGTFLETFLNNHIE